jgi:hypothetical protein
MSDKSQTSFVEELVGVLVQHFGIDRVRAALAKLSNSPVEPSQGRARRPSTRPGHQGHPSITSTLEQLRDTDAEKYRLLTHFYTALKDGRVLPESQDILQFAQIIGLKEIPGKSRKDLLPKLIRFLIDQSTERLQAQINSAPAVSEEQRQQGFSILTDKLLGGR